MNITGKKESSAGRWHTGCHEGFVTAYLCMILMAVMMVETAVISSLNRYYRFQKDLDEFRRMNHAEVIAIHRVKQSYHDYSEEDDSFWVDDCLVELYYDDLTCSIVISSPNYSRSRTLVYDDIEERVREYR